MSQGLIPDMTDLWMYHFILNSVFNLFFLCPGFEGELSLMQTCTYLWLYCGSLIGREEDVSYWSIEE